MKIILKNKVIELDYAEFQKMDEDDFKKLLSLTTEKEESSKKYAGAGRKTKLTKEQIELIQNIATQYPQRSSTSISKDVNEYFKTDNVTKSSVKWWIDKVR